MAQEKRMTKKDFEQELVQKYGVSLLSVRSYEEVCGGKISKMYLYYCKEKHIATWQSGTAWYIN